MDVTFQTTKRDADNFRTVFIGTDQRRTTRLAKVLGDVLGRCIRGKILLSRQPPELVTMNGSASAESCAVPPTTLRAMTIENWTELPFNFIAHRFAQTLPCHLAQGVTSLHNANIQRRPLRSEAEKRPSGGGPLGPERTAMTC